MSKIKVRVDLDDDTYQFFKRLARESGMMFNPFLAKILVEAKQKIEKKSEK